MNIVHYWEDIMYIAIDIGIGVILVVAAVIGILRGFHKQFTKGLCNFIAFFAAIAVTALLLPVFRGMEFYQGFQASAAGWFTDEVFTAQIASVEDLQAAIENSAVAILSGVSEQLFGAMQLAEVDTLGRFFGNAIINVIGAFVLWLAFYLIIKFALFGLRSLLTKAASLPVLKTIDRIFGFIWAEVITYLFVVSLLLTVGEIVVVTFVGDWIEPVRDAIANSQMLNVAHNINIIGSAVAKILGIDLTILTPIV